MPPLSMLGRCSLRHSQVLKTLVNKTAQGESSAILHNEKLQWSFVKNEGEFV